MKKLALLLALIMALCAAVALAETLYGSEALCAEAMNRRAETLGMANTRFVNCTGLEEIHIRVPAATMKFGWTVFNMMTEEGGFGTDVIPATIYVPKGELQNYIGKYANPYSDPEDPMTWEDNVLYEFYKAGRLKEEGDGPVEPQTKGDVNGDDVIDVEDVNGVINMILNISNKGDAADLNGDGVVDVEDVNAIINIILKVK